MTLEQLLDMLGDLDVADESTPVNFRSYNDQGVEVPATLFAVKLRKDGIALLVDRDDN